MAPDMKDTMEIGRDWNTEWRNIWPEEGRVPEFKRTAAVIFNFKFSALT